MSDERTRRVAEAARLSGAGAAILTSLETACYATGHETSIEAGPSPFAGGPTTAVVSADGVAGLVVTNLEEPENRSADDLRRTSAGPPSGQPGLTAEQTAPANILSWSRH